MRATEDAMKLVTTAVCAVLCAGAIAVAHVPTGLAQNSQSMSQGIWTQKAPLPTPRSEVSAAFVNGNIYVLGGGINRFAVPHVSNTIRRPTNGHHACR
jgi:hypothetical protein